MNTTETNSHTRHILYCFLARAWYSPLTADVVSDVRKMMTESKLGGSYQPHLERIHCGFQESDSHERLFFILFEGVTEPLVPLYSSWYLSGSLFEKPLLRLRKSLAELGYARREDNVLTEDHLSNLLETMAVLIEHEDVETQAEFFCGHLGNWLDVFIDHHHNQLAEQPCQVYLATLLLFKAFIESERNLLTPLSKPVPKNEIGNTTANYLNSGNYHVQTE